MFKTTERIGYYLILGVALVTLTNCGRIGGAADDDENAFYVDDQTDQEIQTTLKSVQVTEKDKCPSGTTMEQCANLVRENVARFVNANPNVSKPLPTSSRNYVTSSTPVYGPYGGYGRVNTYYNPYLYGQGVSASGCGVYGCGAAGAHANVYGAGAGFVYSGTYGYAAGGIKCSIIIAGCVAGVGANGSGAIGYCGAYGCTGGAW